MRYLPDWAPGAAFKKKATEWRAKMEEFVDKPYEHLLQRMVSAQASLSSPSINRDVDPCVSSEDAQLSLYPKTPERKPYV